MTERPREHVSLPPSAQGRGREQDNAGYTSPWAPEKPDPAEPPEKPGGIVKKRKNVEHIAILIAGFGGSKK